MKKPKNKKYSLDGAANGRHSRAQNYSFLVPHEKVMGWNPGRGNQLVFFNFILIDYYKHYIVYSIYSVYNIQFEDTLKNTRWLPLPGFQPGTLSCGTRK